MKLLLNVLSNRGNRVELIAENPEFEPIIVDLRQQNFTIEGLAVGLSVIVIGIKFPLVASNGRLQAEGRLRQISIVSF